MKLALLKRWAERLRTHKVLVNMKRIGDNLLKMECDSSVYYVDLARGSSSVFVAEGLWSAKSYQAPFDVSLQRYTSRAMILGASVEGENRILRIELEQRGSYKATRLALQLEFTGRNTNAILLDERGVVMDALRHISLERSWREVKIGEALKPLPQPSQPPREKPLESGLETMELLALEYQKRLGRDLGERKEAAVHATQRRLERLSGLLEGLSDEVALETEARRLREDSALLLANLYRLGDFAPRVRLPSEEGEREVVILAPARSFSEAVQRGFEAAKKLEQKAKNLHIERERLEEKIRFHERQIALIRAAKSLEDVAILSPRKQRKIKGEAKKEEFESFFIEGFKVSFGKNQRENARLLESAKSEDTWLHVRDIPSSHMILHGGKGKIPPPIVRKAAEILVGFLEVSGGSYEVDFTKRKFVKIIEGAQVNYAKHETIIIKKE